MLVLERGEPGSGTSHLAAGMLAPVAEADAGREPLLALGLRSAEPYPGVRRRVGEPRRAIDPGYTRCGTLLVARDGDEADALERELALRSVSVSGRTTAAPSEARRLEPALAPTLRLALDLPADHAVDPRTLVAALATALGGGRRAALRAPAVGRPRRAGTTASRGVVLADGTRIVAEHVVVAAGVWSAPLGGLPADRRVPLRPVKGQIVRLHDPAGPGLLTRVIRMGPSYITPRGDGRYVLGATSEERGFDQTVTAGRDVRAAARRDPSSCRASRSWSSTS